MLRDGVLHCQNVRGCCAPDLAPAYGSDAGGEVISAATADGAPGLIEEIRECGRKQHGQHKLPCATTPRRAGIAGVIDPENCSCLTGVGAAAVVVEMSCLPVTVSATGLAPGATVVLHTRNTSRSGVFEARCPQTPKHSDETRNAGWTKRLNRIIGAGR